MAKRDSTKRRVCPYCKQAYTFTNWMKRHGQRDVNGKILDDTLDCMQQETKRDRQVKFSRAMYRVRWTEPIGTFTQWFNVECWEVCHELICFLQRQGFTVDCKRVEPGDYKSCEANRE